MKLTVPHGSIFLLSSCLEILRDKMCGGMKGSKLSLEAVDFLWKSENCVAEREILLSC